MLVRATTDSPPATGADTVVVGVFEASAPPIFPKGVRAAPRITVLGMRRTLSTGWGRGDMRR